MQWVNATHPQQGPRDPTCFTACIVTRDTWPVCCRRPSLPSWSTMAWPCWRTTWSRDTSWRKYPGGTTSSYLIRWYLTPDMYILYIVTTNTMFIGSQQEDWECVQQVQTHAAEERWHEQKGFNKHPCQVSVPRPKTVQFTLYLLFRIDELLASKGTRFLTGDTMCCFDCELMPKLQHIRVAGHTHCLLSMCSVDTSLPGSQCRPLVPHQCRSPMIGAALLHLLSQTAKLPNIFASIHTKLQCSIGAPLPSVKIQTKTRGRAVAVK